MSHVEKAETWKEKMDSELKQLKTEMIERVIEKIKEKNKNDAFLYIWKDLVVDYLLDEGESSDKINDFFLWIGINLLSTSADQLKDLREKIKNSNTEEELKDLEASIIESLSKMWDNQEENTWFDSSWSTKSHSRKSTSDDKTSETDVSIESAPLWQAKEIPLNQRKKRLFPNWVPTIEKEMKKYLTKIKVPILINWKKKKITLDIHKKLANEYKAIFQEMYDKKIPVNQIKWYKRRLVRGSKTKKSHHSYWSAVDINRNVNGGVYGYTDKSSPYFNSQETVDIRKKHGFYRWWDRKTTYDPMHFTYMNW